MRLQSAKITHESSNYTKGDINSDLRIASIAQITSNSTRAQLEVRLKPCIKRPRLNSTTYQHQNNKISNLTIQDATLSRIQIRARPESHKINSRHNQLVSRLYSNTS